MEQGWVVIGVVARPHGVKGELRVRPFNSDSDVLLGCRTVRVGERSRAVVAARRERAAILLRIEGCASREEADGLRGCEVAVPREALPPPDPDEYYHHDLIGLQALGADGVALGRVLEVTESPGHATISIARKGQTAVLEVPLADTWIERVDLERGTIVVRGAEDLPGWDEYAGRRS